MNNLKITGQSSNINVGILFIATGRYIIFWKEFYEACEKFFLPNCNKVYFLFTDNSDFAYENNPNVYKVLQDNLGWPNNTLLRFDMFLKVQDKLKLMDYLYFINGTMLPVREINNEIFPTKEQGLMVTLHPGCYKRSRLEYTYDENPQSTAYIPKNKGKFYFMGGFNGGTSEAFLEMSRELSKNIHQDLEKNIVALWHDESHLNHYMLDKSPLILTPMYGYPEGVPFNQENLKEFENNYKMFIKDKNNPKYGGVNYLRGMTVFDRTIMGRTFKSLHISRKQF